MKRQIAIALIAVLVVAALGSAAYARSPITWSDAGAAPFMLNMVSSTVVNGEMWVIGGSDGGSSFESNSYATVKIYNPVTGWRDGPSLNQKRMKAQAVTIGSKIYVFGGQTKNDAGQTIRLDSLEIYDTDHPELGWQYGATAPRAVGYFGMTVAQGKIWVAGGETNSLPNPPNPNTTITGYVQIYDPVTNTWTHPDGTTAPANLGWADNGSNTWGSQLTLNTVKSGNYEWVVATGGSWNGAQSKCRRVNAVEGGPNSKSFADSGAIQPGKLDTAEGTNSGSGVSGQSSFVYDNTIYVLDGTSAGTSSYSYNWFNQVEYYDPSGSGSWKYDSDMPARLSGHFTACVIGNKIYVVGGKAYNGSSAVLNPEMYIGTIPEPSSIAAIVLGLGMLASAVVKRKKS